VSQSAGPAVCLPIGADDYCYAFALSLSPPFRHQSCSVSVHDYGRCWNARDPKPCTAKAKFHYTGPTGPARTLSEIRTDPTEFLGDPGREKVRAGPVGSGRVRVVEFSLKCGRLADTPDNQLAQ